jgi:hypothetical protein
MSVAAASRPSPAHLAAGRTAGAQPWRRLLASGLTWGFVVSGAAAFWILFVLDGWHYYATPLAVRGYEPAHSLLRPSGPAGQTFGVIGTLLMLMPFVYMARKRIGRMKPAGTLKTWLQIHLFCGVAGPVLITFHTSFKFNGLISAAYWSMVLVMLSGFVGRYLYVRIPRSLRGHELTRAELDTQAEELKESIASSRAPDSLLQRLDAFERASVPEAGRMSLLDLLFGDVSLGRKLRALQAELSDYDLAEHQRANLFRLTAERATLRRRTTYLRLTKQLFDLWHVFHLPLVYLLLIIAAAHIGVAAYLGYVPFRW